MPPNRRRGPLPELLQLETPAVAVRLRVNARARRFTLRVTAEGEAVLTLPPGQDEAAARGFLERHAAWLEAARARLPEPAAIAPGLRLPVDGRPLRLVAGTGRSVRHDPQAGTLALPGARPAGPALAAWLKARARERMAPLAHGFAARLGREVAAISLRDTRSRWGSCSARGALSFSWRIAMAPPEVQAYLAAHEAAHLREMNHGPRYWTVLAGLMPDYETPRQWLRREGRALHRYRFDS